jgi:hypothetical protein
LHHAMYIQHAMVLQTLLLLLQVVLLCRHRRRCQRSHWSSAWSSWAGESVITVTLTGMWVSGGQVQLHWLQWQARSVVKLHSMTWLQWVTGRQEQPALPACTCVIATSQHH